MNAPLKLPQLLPVLAPVLAVENLRVTLDNGADVVAGISFELEAGQVLGLVGESGSGKTTLATALLGHVRKGARIAGGAVRIGGHDILQSGEQALRALRGKLVAHVAQDPATALNPLHRVGRTLEEALSLHEPALDRAARRARVAQTLVDVGLSQDEEFLGRFPHQLSGGQQQRLLLALAFLPRPALIVLDEPTTALDVTTQARILATIRRLCESYGAAALYVSHDLAVVYELASRVMVMYAGRVVESAPVASLFTRPAHPYTKGLLAAIPDIGKASAPRPIPGQAPGPGHHAGCAFAARCEWRTEACAGEQSDVAIGGAHTRHLVACGVPEAREAQARIRFVDLPSAQQAREPLLAVSHANAWYGDRQVLFGAGLEVAPGECLALVGESGSGKTTFARLLAGLGANGSADIRYGDALLDLQVRSRSAVQRREIQYIFQNPYRALNPRQTVGTILRHVLHQVLPQSGDAQQHIERTLERVALPRRVLESYPSALSGGERQRVAIARALLCEPRLLICDEITSALDVSVQAAIIELLQQLQAGGLAIVFVTHNLGVVRSMADRVLVLRHGRVVEQGGVSEVLERPQHEYTRTLVGDSPSIRAFQPY
jgi:peptide/nickel transport system ATP-binding protein